MGFFHDKVRYLILTITVLTLVHVYTNLLLFNFTILCMKESQTVYAVINGTNITETTMVEIFRPEEKATLYSVVAIGMLFSVLFIMIFIRKVGGRITFTVYGLVSGVATILLPIFAEYNFGAVVFVRFLQVSIHKNNNTNNKPVSGVVVSETKTCHFDDEISLSQND